MEKIDKAIEILQAFKEGKTIEWCNAGKEDWKSYQQCPKRFETLNFDFMHYDYRIAKEPTYRPYANAEEFLKASKEHGPYLGYDTIHYTPVEISNNGITTCFNYNTDGRCRYSSFKEILNRYTWADGTPCGILEQ